MLTTLLLVATLAGPPTDWADEFPPPTAGKMLAADFLDKPKRDSGVDAPNPGDIRRMAAALQAEMAADQVLTTRAGQRLVLTALLCEATQLLVAEGRTTRAARDRLHAQAERSQLRLDVLAMQPLACDAWPVERLIGCLGILPQAACIDDDGLAALVRAAERLTEATP